MNSELIDTNPDSVSNIWGEVGNKFNLTSTDETPCIDWGKILEERCQFYQNKDGEIEVLKHDSKCQCKK